MIFIRLPSQKFPTPIKYSGFSRKEYIYFDSSLSLAKRLSRQAHRQPCTRLAVSFVCCYYVLQVFLVAFFETLLGFLYSFSDGLEYFLATIDVVFEPIVDWRCSYLKGFFLARAGYV